MKHVYQPGNSPAKKKPNTDNSFDLLTDEMTDESYAAAASFSAESPAGGKPGTRSHSTNANGSDIPPTTPPPSGSATADSGSAPTPPAWFKAFELRQEERLDDILGLCREEHKGMCHAISILKDEVDKLSKKLEEADLKIDDLENWGRRNNIVLYRVPEGEEKKNCVNFVEDLLDQAGSTMGKNIQRAHRTGPPLAASKKAVVLDQFISGSLHSKRKNKPERPSSTTSSQRRIMIQKYMQYQTTIPSKCKSGEKRKSQN